MVTGPMIDELRARLQFGVEKVRRGRFKFVQDSVAARYAGESICRSDHAGNGGCRGKAEHSRQK
ncbi:hypothetical protein ASD44_11085 [Mesorhizobium sp. Root554]|nr:hypothetical protein ASD27_11095 [Mesorhizobium sp. Root1471]KQZ37062.1 hypothetical protein ASD44_11085 [Mesorhizobium sp. Root554]